MATSDSIVGISEELWGLERKAGGGAVQTFSEVVMKYSAADVENGSDLPVLCRHGAAIS